MMRKLKFRFWLKKEKKMCSWELMKKECNRLSVLEMQDFIPLQFTGLLDKQGVEIYEGDIVKICETYIGDTSIPPHNAEIKFDDGSFYNDSQALFDVLSVNENYWEVIGNIYENPELLKGE